MFGRTHRYIRVLLSYVGAVEGAVKWTSATFMTHSGAADPFKPLRRLGPKSSLKAECTMVGSCAYFSEQGQEVISIVVVIS